MLGEKRKSRLTRLFFFFFFFYHLIFFFFFFFLFFRKSKKRWMPRVQIAPIPNHYSLFWNALETSRKKVDQDKSTYTNSHYKSLSLSHHFPQERIKAYSLSVFFSVSLSLSTTISGLLGTSLLFVFSQIF